MLLCPPQTHTSPNRTFFKEIEPEPEVAVIEYGVSDAAVGGILVTNLHLSPKKTFYIHRPYIAAETFNNSSFKGFSIELYSHWITGRDKSPNSRRGWSSLQNHVVSIIVCKAKRFILSCKVEVSSMQRKQNTDLLQALKLVKRKKKQTMLWSSFFVSIVSRLYAARELKKKFTTGCFNSDPQSLQGYF